MPRASSADSFVWRAAARPDRARLLGAIAIAVSCGGLGVMAGRWSAQLAPPDPGTRTAALIEAVAKETQAKPTQQASTAESSRAMAPVGPPPEPAAAPGGLEAPETAAPRMWAAPTALARDREHDEAARPATTDTGEARGEDLPTAPPAALPTSPPSHQPPTIGARSAGARSAAPNYQALRDYVLRR